MTERKYSREETARRGKEIYDRVVKPTLRPEDDLKVVAIDIETEDFEIDHDLHAVGTRLKGRRPDAVLWMQRVGRPTLFKVGGSWPKREGE